MVMMTDTLPAMSADEHKAYDAGRSLNADREHISGGLK